MTKQKPIDTFMETLTKVLDAKNIYKHKYDLYKNIITFKQTYDLSSLP